MFKSPSVFCISSGETSSRLTPKLVHETGVITIGDSLSRVETGPRIQGSGTRIRNGKTENEIN